MISVFLAAASAAALLHSTMVTSGPLVPDGAATGPLPQNGVWALLPADCDPPTSLDLSSWPKCATPIGFADDEVAALERPAPGNKATPTEFYSIGRAKYAVTAGASPDAPAVVQVAAPALFGRSYYYIAITPAAPLDDAGRFAAAQGWPIACLPKDQGGCNPKALTEVQTQAAIEPTDPKRLYRMVRILPPAPAAGSVTEAPLPPAIPAPPATTDAPAPAAPTTSPN